MSQQLCLELDPQQSFATRVDWFAVAMSDEVAQRLLLIAKAHPGEWMKFRDFYPLAVELNIRAHLGHALY